MVLALLLLGACQTPTQDQQDQEPAAAGENAALPVMTPEGRAYRLVSMDDAPVLEGSEVTIQFKDNRIAGSAGANRYFANVAYEAPDKLSLSPVGSTMMFKDEPVGLMAQEQAYLAALQASSSFVLTSEGLVLSGTLEDRPTGLVFSDTGEAE